MAGNDQTDVVVIGSGACGLVAALTAAEAGAKVIVVEKQRSIGGTSNFLDGTFAVESEMQRKRYITFSRDEAFKAIMEYSHWRANPRLVRAIVDESAGTISWLQGHGVEFSDATINMPNSPRTYHVVKGQGAALIKALATVAKEKGVDIRTGTPAKRILKEGNCAAGVVAEHEGDEPEIAAKAVIIASGGFANNREWIKKYAGFDLDVNAIPVGNVDKTGDGIRMAFEVGAADEGLGVLELNNVGPVGPEFAMKNAIEMVVAQPDLWVDPRGERFCNEEIGFYGSSTGNAGARYKDGWFYRLFDDSIKETLLKKGIERNVGMDNPPGTRPVNIEKELGAALSRGSTEVFAGDSMGELAGNMGIDKQVLKATVEEYNAFCEKGHDDLFAKNPKYLRPLRGARFYAVKTRTVFLGTLGGIEINHKAEVLDKKGKVIPGLYAGGYDAGGMYGDSYCISTTSGLSSAFATNSGRIAGRSAVEYMKR
ncbi:MAG TPA: FAD-dependent oxidoreductase [Syntrophorhabdales bacterium]|nr:FAD-dependent oxidoreductase [Syntrophorhabdales bacterium]